MSIQEAKDILEAIGDAKIQEILELKLAGETEKALKKLEDFCEDWIAEQKELLKEYTTRAESAGNSCEEYLIAIQQIEQRLNDISADCKEKLEATTTASEQAQTSAETAQRASETANDSARTAQEANENINSLVKQAEEAYKNIIENAEHLHQDAQEVTTALDKAQEILPVIREFIEMFPELEEIKTTIDNIKNEILPDLRRIQQVLLDTLDSSNEIYMDLKESVIPRADDLLTQLQEIIPRAEALDLEDMKNNLVLILEYKEDIDSLIPIVETIKEELQKLQSSTEEHITIITNKRNQSLEALHQKEQDSVKLIEDTTILKQEVLKNTTEDLTNKANTDIKAQQQTSTDEFTELADATLGAFNDIAEEEKLSFTNLADEKLTNLLNFLQTQENLDIEALTQLNLKAPLLNLITQNLQINGTDYMEIGVNDNGHYVKFANGLLLCWDSEFTNKQITFPCSFINDKYIPIALGWSFERSEYRMYTTSQGSGNVASHVEDFFMLTIQNTGFTLSFTLGSNIIGRPYSYFYAVLGYWK